MTKRSSSMPVARRLALAFGATILVMLAMATLGLWKMGEVEDRLTDIADGNNVEMRLAFSMRGAVNEIAIATRDLVLTNDDAKVKLKIAAIAASRDRYDESEHK